MHRKMISHMSAEFLRPTINVEHQLFYSKEGTPTAERALII